MINVKIGDLELEAKIPESFAIRDEVVSAAVDNWRRASYAALGLSCEALKLPFTYRACSYNPLVYGGRVLDELCRRGLDRHEVAGAAILVWSTLSASLITEDEVAEEEDFLGLAEVVSTT